MLVCRVVIATNESVRWGHTPGHMPAHTITMGCGDGRGSPRGLTLRVNQTHLDDSARSLNCRFTGWWRRGGGFGDQGTAGGCGGRRRHRGSSGGGVCSPQSLGHRTPTRYGVATIAKDVPRQATRPVLALVTGASGLRAGAFPRCRCVKAFPLRPCTTLGRSIISLLETKTTIPPCVFRAALELSCNVPTVATY
jgi:hypothetical protein